MSRIKKSRPNIRAFRMSDYDGLISLWDAAGLHYNPEGRDSRAELRKQIAFRNTLYLVAEIDDRIMGSLLGTHDGRKGWLNRLAVAPAHRREGLATRLVKEAEKRFARQGIDMTACLVEDWNRDSMRFFESMGYERFPGIEYFRKRKDPRV